MLCLDRRPEYLTDSEGEKHTQVYLLPRPLTSRA